MSIVFACACGRKLQAQDEHAGRRVRCPVCGAESTIPRPEAVLPAETAAGSPTPPAAPSPEKTVNLSGAQTLHSEEAPVMGRDDQADETRSRPRRRFDEEGDADSEDARRPGEPQVVSKKAVLSLVLGLLSFVLTLLTGIPAIILGVMGMREADRSGGRVSGRGVALAGLISGIVGSVVSLAVFGVVALAFLGFRAMQGAVGKVQTAAVRVQDANNLKQIGLAMHSYHDANKGQLPGRGAITGKDGKPLLSWRVALLPYIGRGDLYGQFKLDQPWDSEHNKALLPLMPPEYGNPRNPAEWAEGLTHYRAFTGPDTAFEPVNGRPPSLAGIMDGTSNTFMVVEAADPVGWTRPEDLVYDPKKPLPRLGGLHPGGFNAVMWDGAVKFIPDATPEGTLRGAITARGGEVINLP